jgi:organic radical activating enzyme
MLDDWMKTGIEIATELRDKAEAQEIYDNPRWVDEIGKTGIGQWEGPFPCDASLGNVSIVGIQDRGLIKPCCQFNGLGGGEDELSRDWPAIHNLNSLQDIYKENRWLEYEPNKHCSTCIREEKGNVFSLRDHWNGRFTPWRDEDVSQDGKPELQSLELAFDNTCNMMCRICNPGQSSKWSASPVVNELRKHIPDTNYFQVNNQKVKNYREDLKRVLANSDLSKLRQVLFVGGEPLYTKAIPWFINLLREKRPDDYQKIEITCVTNGGLMPDPTLFENFKVKFQVSIDGIGDLQTATRLKIPWETIDKNIRAMKELDFVNELTIHSTISVLNINKMSDIINYCYEIGVQLNMALLHYPAYYRLDIIPNEIREKWIEYNGIYDWNYDGPIRRDEPEMSENLYNKIAQNDLIESYLKMPYNKNVAGVKHFLAAIEITDKESTIKFRDANPEIIEVMEGLYKQFKEKGEYDLAVENYFAKLS